MGDSLGNVAAQNFPLEFAIFHSRWLRRQRCFSAIKKQPSIFSVEDESDTVSDSHEEEDEAVSDEKEDIDEYAGWTSQSL